MSKSAKILIGSMIVITSLKHARNLTEHKTMIYLKVRLHQREMREAVSPSVCRERTRLLPQSTVNGQKPAHQVTAERSKSL